jgi:hypothetical protein
MEHLDTPELVERYHEAQSVGNYAAMQKIEAELATRCVPL